MFEFEWSSIFIAANNILNSQLQKHQSLAKMPLNLMPEKKIALSGSIFIPLSFL
jgi:hypothetical protein